MTTEKKCTHETFDSLQAHFDRKISDLNYAIGKIKSKKESLEKARIRILGEDVNGNKIIPEGNHEKSNHICYSATLNGSL